MKSIPFISVLIFSCIVGCGESQQGVKEKAVAEKTVEKTADAEKSVVKTDEKKTLEEKAADEKPKTVVQVLLDRLNAWDKSHVDVYEYDYELYRQQINVGVVDEDTEDYIRDCKGRLAMVGVKVKWNPEKKVYETVELAKSEADTISDLEKIQGHWFFNANLTFGINTVRIKGNTVKSFAGYIDDRIEWYDDSGVTEVTFKLDESKTPKELDLILKKDGKISTLLLTYYLKGDRLIVWGLGDESKTRPTPAPPNTKEGDELSAIVFARIAETLTEQEIQRLKGILSVGEVEWDGKQ